MQSISRLFWAPLLAHLLADFPLQTDLIVERKRNTVLGYAEHGIIHLIVLELCLAIFTSVSLVSSFIQITLAGYVLLHLVIDYVKRFLIQRRSVQDSTLSFLIDQAAHIATICALVYVVARLSWPAERWNLNLPNVPRDRLLITGVTYVAVIFVGGYLIRYLTRPMSQKLEARKETPDELRNAGLYIGWLERFLILTAILIQSPAMVGLILTGKSIVRFPEAKEPRFAEYFLIGTFLSMSIAIIGGLILARAIYGSVTFK